MLAGLITQRFLFVNCSCIVNPKNSISIYSQAASIYSTSSVAIFLWRNSMPVSSILVNDQNNSICRASHMAMWYMYAPYFFYIYSDRSRVHSLVKEIGMWLTFRPHPCGLFLVGKQNCLVVPKNIVNVLVVRSRHPLDERYNNFKIQSVKVCMSTLLVLQFIPCPLELKGMFRKAASLKPGVFGAPL